MSTEASENTVPEDMASIIRADSSDNNISAFQRYAVPPQFDGNSSEDEEGPQTGETKLEELDINDEHVNEEDVESADAGYTPLIMDEFGEFVSSETFGDYNIQSDVSDPNFLHVSRITEPSATNIQIEEVKDCEAPVVTLNTVQTSRISIPPLDAGENTIIYCRNVVICFCMHHIEA